VKAWHNLAVIHREQNNWEWAEARWRQAFLREPRFPPARAGLIEALVAQRKWSAARLLAEEFAKHDDPLIQCDRVLLLTQIDFAYHEYEAGRRRLQRAIIDYPGLAAPHELLARHCFEMGNFTLACSVLDTLTNLEPSNGAAWHNYGLALISLNRLSDAHRAFQSSLAVRPESPQTQEQLELLEKRINYECSI
jgi:Flp pilus assembly protein TadD